MLADRIKAVVTSPALPSTCSTTSRPGPRAGKLRTARTSDRAGIPSHAGPVVRRDHGFAAVFEVARSPWSNLSTVEWILRQRLSRWTTRRAATSVNRRNCAATWRCSPGRHHRRDRDAAVASCATAQPAAFVRRLNWSARQSVDDRSDHRPRTVSGIQRRTTTRVVLRVHIDGIAAESAAQYAVAGAAGIAVCGRY